MVNVTIYSIDGSYGFLRSAVLKVRLVCTQLHVRFSVGTVRRGVSLFVPSHLEDALLVGAPLISNIFSSETVAAVGLPHSESFI
jgi:hypothetical protein